MTGADRGESFEESVRQLIGHPLGNRFSILEGTRKGISDHSGWLARRKDRLESHDRNRLNALQRVFLSEGRFSLGATEGKEETCRKKEERPCASIG